MGLFSATERSLKSTRLKQQKIEIAWKIKSYAIKDSTTNKRDICCIVETPVCKRMCPDWDWVCVQFGITHCPWHGCRADKLVLSLLPTPTPRQSDREESRQQWNNSEIMPLLFSLFTPPSSPSHTLQTFPTLCLLLRKKTQQCCFLFASSWLPPCSLWLLHRLIFERCYKYSICTRTHVNTL